MSCNSSVIFHLNNFSSHPKISDFRLFTWKWTRFIMSFFKLRISLRLNFASSFSLMTHNYSEIPQFKNYILWTTRSQQYTAFQTFIFHTASSESIYILHHCPVSWKLTPVYFLAQTLYAFYKSSPSKCQFSNFPLLILKFTKSLMSFFEQKVKVWITLQCKVRSFFYTFFAETLYGIDKSNTSKWKVLELSLLTL